MSAGDDLMAGINRAGLKASLDHMVAEFMSQLALRDSHIAHLERRIEQLEANYGQPKSAAPMADDIPPHTNTFGPPATQSGGTNGQTSRSWGW